MTVYFQIRSAFIRKVYSMLFVMIVFTTAVGAVMRTQAVMSFVQANQWAPILAMVCSFAFLFGTCVAASLSPRNCFSDHEDNPND